MGCADLFCFVCGNRYDSFDNFLDDYLKNKSTVQEEDIRNAVKKSAWMSDITMLLSDGEIVHDCTNSNCYNEFIDKSYKVYFHLEQTEDFDKYGIFLHTDCWKYIQKKYGIDLTYNDLPIILAPDMDPFEYVNINYGAMKQYWAQDFKLLELLKNACPSPLAGRAKQATRRMPPTNKHMYMLESPLIDNKQNITRINKILKQFKIKNKKEASKRKSPNVSATFFDEGVMKFGNDGNLWIIKNNKWVLTDEKFVTVTHFFNPKKKRDKKVYQLPRIYDSTKVPIYINKVNGNTVDFLVSTKLVEKFKKQFLK